MRRASKPKSGLKRSFSEGTVIGLSGKGSLSARPLSGIVEPIAKDENCDWCEEETSKPPEDSKPPKVFVCAGSSSELMQRIFRSWGWQENEDVNSKVFDLKWTSQYRMVDKLVLPETQLVNHFRGTDVLNHKGKMARYLQRCPVCSDIFFPRQYNVHEPKEFRRLLCDHIATQALFISRTADAVSDCDVASENVSGPCVRDLAAEVLKRCSKEHIDCNTPVLRCAHECSALLGPSGQVPPKQESILKPRFAAFLESAKGEPGACNWCSRAADEDDGDLDAAVPGNDGVPRWCRQYKHAGPANAWVVKDPCLSRGRSVTILSGLRSILAQCEKCKSSGLRWNCVVQKYIEHPLLVPSEDGFSPPSKADLRVWVLVLDWNPLIAFAHPDAYFRVATRPYQFVGTGKAETEAHATNCRDEDNRVTLKALLSRFGPSGRSKWDDITWPLLLDGVRATLLAVKEGVLGVDLAFRKNRRSPCPSGPRAFELFGFDFAVDDSWKPWLLEANTSPDMLRSCGVPEIRAWSEKATEDMLKIALAYHAKNLQIPKVSDLRSWPDSDSASGVRRLFTEELLSEPGHCGTNCYGMNVASVPSCLLSGLDLGERCGGWRLIIREGAVDDEVIWQSYQTEERKIRAWPGDDGLTHTRVLREWLMPMPSSKTSSAAANHSTPTSPTNHAVGNRNMKLSASTSGLNVWARSTKGV